MSASTPDYVLYVGSKPSSDRAKGLANSLNEQAHRLVIEIVNIRLISRRPTWLVGAPTLVTNAKQPKVWQGNKALQVIQTLIGALHHPPPEPPLQLQRDDGPVSQELSGNIVADNSTSGEGGVDLVTTASSLDTFISIG